MKKILLSAFVVLTFIAYTFQQRHEGVGSVVIAPSNKVQNTQSSNSADSSSGSSPPQTNTSGGSSSSSQNSTTYKDGKYTGNAADAFYGYIQVKAIISSGKITDVQFLQYPNDRQNSIYINSQAMPWLKQEAIKAQNARVDIISGATDTSNAFIESLTNALNQALA